MKIAGLIVIVVHAFIHFIGFAKAFQWGQVTQIAKEISKPVGILWLLAGILFILAAFFLYLKTQFWWMPGLIAVLISQGLIVFYWSDAKYGTLANVLILFMTLAGLFGWKFNRSFLEDVNIELKNVAKKYADLLTEGDLAGLPVPVQNYLRYTQCLGKPKVQNFKVLFSGQIRKNEASDWMFLHTSQYNTLEHASRLFYMNAVMKQLPVAGYHRYKDRKAFMDIRLLSMFRVQYLDGNEMDLAETVTFFNDMCVLAPASLIDKRIRWLTTDGNRVNARFTNGDLSVTAWLYFNDEGQLVNFSSEDRYNADAGKKMPWSTPLYEYRDYHGYNLASKAEAIYHYAEGPVVYGNFTLVDVNYNVEKAE